MYYSVVLENLLVIKIASVGLKSFISLREQSFLILSTGAEDFSQGYETFLHYFVGVRKFYEQFLWGAKLFCLKKFWMKSPIKD